MNEGMRSYRNEMRQIGLYDSIGFAALERLEPHYHGTSERLENGSIELLTVCPERVRHFAAADDGSHYGESNAPIGTNEGDLLRRSVRKRTDEKADELLLGQDGLHLHFGVLPVSLLQTNAGFQVLRFEMKIGFE